VYILFIVYVVGPVCVWSYSY